MADVKSMAGVTQAIAASALRAQQARMRIIAENLANANSTAQTPGGDPYRRQVPVFSPTTVSGEYAQCRGLPTKNAIFCAGWVPFISV